MLMQVLSCGGYDYRGDDDGEYLKSCQKLTAGPSSAVEWAAAGEMDEPRAFAAVASVAPAVGTTGAGAVFVMGKGVKIRSSFQPCKEKMNHTIHALMRL